MAERGEGVPAPNQWQQQQQQQQEQNQHPQNQPQQQHLHINWSNFKPEFSGKPDEDPEVHLLCSNDWMNVHHFSKVLPYTIRRGKIMVSLFRTNNCRLARTAEFI